MTRAEAWRAVNMRDGVRVTNRGRGLAAGRRGTLRWFGSKRATIEIGDEHVCTVAIRDLEVVR